MNIVVKSKVPTGVRPWQPRFELHCNILVSRSITAVIENVLPTTAWKIDKRPPDRMSVCCVVVACGVVFYQQIILINITWIFYKYNHTLCYNNDVHPCIIQTTASIQMIFWVWGLLRCSSMLFGVILCMPFCVNTFVNMCCKNTRVNTTHKTGNAVEQQETVCCTAILLALYSSRDWVF